MQGHDAQQLIKLLNILAQKAVFTLGVKDMTDFVKLLNWAHSELLPKLETLEIVSVTVPKKEQGRSKT